MHRNNFKLQFSKEVVTSSWISQYIGFFIIGVFCFAIDIFLLYLLKDIFKSDLYLSASLAFVLATFINYLLNLRYVFVGGKHARHKEILLFFLVGIGGLIFTLILMYVLVDLLFLFYLVAKVITVLVVSFYSFLFRKYFVFIR